MRCSFSESIRIKLLSFLRRGLRGAADRSNNR